MQLQQSTCWWTAVAHRRHCVLMLLQSHLRHRPSRPRPRMHPRGRRHRRPPPHTRTSNATRASLRQQRCPLRSACGLDLPPSHPWWTPTQQRTQPHTSQPPQHAACTAHSGFPRRRCWRVILRRHCPVGHRASRRWCRPPPAPPQRRPCLAPGLFHPPTLRWTFFMSLQTQARWRPRPLLRPPRHRGSGSGERISSHRLGSVQLTMR